jgi:hypothetical protein
MTVIESSVRKPNVIKGEISAMENLITRRHMWLNKPENKLRTTYKAVLKDTEEMEDKLTALRAELSTSETNAKI